MATSRRRFLRETALLAGGLTGGLAAAPLLKARQGNSAAQNGGARADVTRPGAANRAPSALPQRVLGRTREKVSLIGIGLAPLGSGNTSAADVERIVGAALDQGINYVDVAPNYGNAESKLKGVMKTRRDDLFLVTKVEPDRPDRAGVQKQLEESLGRMGTDRVDAVHIHNLGDWDMERLFAPDGTLAGLKEARRRGLIKYIAASGHMRPQRFVRAIESGDIDLTMVALNFADRSTYDFEGLVIPAAQKQGAAVVAMKVLGGSIGWRYDGKTSANLAAHYDRAIRYSLGLPGVACAVIGMSNEDEVRRAAEAARSYKPLPPPERLALLEEGRKIGAQRGLYYGPVDG